MKITAQPVIRKNLLPVLLLFLLAFAGGCGGRPAAGPDTEVYSFTAAEGANSYIAANDGRAAVIDPALQTGQLIAALREKKLEPVYLILTHGHFDHILGIEQVVRQFPGIKVYIHPADLDKLADPVKNLSARFGAPVAIKGVDAIPLKKFGDLKLGRETVTVTLTPGHTPGSVILKIGDNLFTGDTLFKGTAGRTDFPGGSPEALAASLRGIKKLADNLKVYPGHGEPTTLGEEKRSNPFLEN